MRYLGGKSKIAKANAVKLPCESRGAWMGKCGLCRGIQKVPTYWETGAIWRRCPWCYIESDRYAQAIPTKTSHRITRINARGSIND